MVLLFMDHILKCLSLYAEAIRYLSPTLGNIASPYILTPLSGILVMLRAIYFYEVASKIVIQLSSSEHII